MILQVSNVKKNFGEQTVLNGVSLSVNRGDVISILGPSGSGKTTLLRCINFLERPDGGRMNFGDMELDMPNATRRQISDVRERTGFVFQSYNLFANKTALQNVTEGLIVARRMKRPEAEEIANASLRKVGMWEKRGSYPHQLSGGQQQRVAIARAIAATPDVVLFDEPTSALDPELTGEVLRVIRELKSKDRTMIVVTHEMDFARSVADVVIYMADGVIEEVGTPEEVFGNPKSEKTRSFLRDAQEKF